MREPETLDRPAKRPPALEVRLLGRGEPPGELREPLSDRLARRLRGGAVLPLALEHLGDLLLQPRAQGVQLGAAGAGRRDLLDPLEDVGAERVELGAAFGLVLGRLLCHGRLEAREALPECVRLGAARRRGVVPRRDWFASSVRSASSASSWADADEAVSRSSSRRRSKSPRRSSSAPPSSRRTASSASPCDEALSAMLRCSSSRSASSPARCSARLRRGDLGEPAVEIVEATVEIGEMALERLEGLTPGGGLGYGGLERFEALADGRLVAPALLCDLLDPPGMRGELLADRVERRAVGGGRVGGAVGELLHAVQRVRGRRRGERPGRAVARPARARAGQAVDATRDRVDALGRGGGSDLVLDPVDPVAQPVRERSEVGAQLLGRRGDLVEPDCECRDGVAPFVGGLRRVDLDGERCDRLAPLFGRRR